MTDMLLNDFTWGVEPHFKDLFLKRVEEGRSVAAGSGVAIVMICRNSMPHLTKTLPLVKEVAGFFERSKVYAYENDSTDGTLEELFRWAEGKVDVWVDSTKSYSAQADERGFSDQRTNRLAACRQRCQDWVRNCAPDADWVIVLDSDPHGGFDPLGVLNSIGWFYHQCNGHADNVGCMASYSLFVRRNPDGTLGVAQYDAWAARLNDWRDTRQHQWFHLWLPPVGSPPVPMYSAFGGLAVYDRTAYLSGVYCGGDCEHVAFHKSMHAAGYKLYLNPGSRYVAVLP